jgi:hypothetical protein
MFHQVKGRFLPLILRDQEIRPTPRFELTGKSQEQLESELSPRRSSGGVLLFHHSVVSDGREHLLIWEKGERPVVWLTQEDKPISAVWYIPGAELEDAEKEYQGFYRIGIDTTKIRVYPWREFQQQAKVSPKWRRILADAAGGDDTSKWYFSLAPIPSVAWTVLHRWEQSQWVPYWPGIQQAIPE